LACEILTADVFSIVETLCNDEKYLPMLWQFLYEESRLNPLIGRYPLFPWQRIIYTFSLFSFNSKVLSMLLGQRTLLYIDYVTKVEGFVDMFMKHLGTSAMMDLLLQMIAAPDNDQHRLELANVSDQCN
jgi:serine/threonine-protein phosphatase 6 regulatory subunit 3